MKKHRFVLLLLLLAGFKSYAQWNLDPKMNTPICTATGDQVGDPNMISDGDGGMIIAWMDGRNSSIKIYAQHIDKNGMALWPVDGVAVSDLVLVQGEPKLVPDGKGGAIIIIEEEPNNNVIANIYAQHIDANGVLQWGTTGVVVSNATYSQSFAAAATDNNGGAYIAWADNRTNANGKGDIYAQHINATGQSLWAINGIPVCNAGGYDEFPEVLDCGTKGAFFAWDDGRDAKTSDANAVYVKYIDYNGNSSWPAGGVALSQSLSGSGLGNIVHDATDGVIVTWSDTRTGNSDIYAQHLNNAGALLWANSGLPVCVIPGWQQFGETIAMPDGGFVVAIESIPVDSSAFDIIAQRVDANGNLKWNSNGVTITAAPNYQASVQIIDDKKDGVYFTWDDDRTGLAEDYYDIYAQHIDGNGSLLWDTAGIAICTAPHFQGELADKMVWNDCGPLVAWIDERISTNDFLYTTRVMNPLPPVINIAASSQTICTGTTVNFSSAIKNIDATPLYQWIKNGKHVGIDSSGYADTNLQDNDSVYCIVTNTDTCNIRSANSDTLAIKVKLSAAIQLAITTPNTTICKGSPASFTAVPKNNTSSLTYQWKLNDVDVGANSATYTNSTLLNNDKIYCIGTAATAGCTSNTTYSDTITIAVTDTAATQLTITTADNNICKGSPASFTAIPQNNTAPLTYHWKLNGNDVGANSDTYTSNTLTDNDKIYCVGNATPSACSNNTALSNTITVIINVVPAVSITPIDTSVLKGVSVQLNAVVTGNIVSYQWTPAMGLVNASTLSPVTIPLIESTGYTLSVLSTEGCQAEKTTRIVVSTSTPVTPPTLLPLYMPSAFSPNGDGVNDVYRVPPGTAFLLEELSVYDRWGNNLFTSADINKGWDGTYKGNSLNAGTYVYMLKGINESKPIVWKGSFLLIR